LVADFDLPNAFFASKVVIIISSIALFFAKKSIQKGNRGAGTVLLWASFLLGAAFIALQFRGFGQIISEGYYFTGPTSTINSSYIYLLVLAHLAHVAAGLVVLLVLIYKHSKQQYRPGQMLGLQLGAIFWHFVDILWIFLFVFFIF
jgi:cytochrome c oxidase subunit 3